MTVDRLGALLDQLARQCGIGDSYRNWRGDLMQVSAATKKAILEAMDCPTGDADAVERVLRERDSARWLSPLPPVAVVHPGRTSVAVAIDGEDVERTLEWVIALEGGGERHGRVHPHEMHEIESREVDGRWRTRRALA